MTIINKIEKMKKKVENGEILIYYSIFLWEIFVVKRIRGKYYNILKLLFNILKSFFTLNKVKKQEYEVAFFSFLARNGDFGIIYPIVKEFDKNNRKIIFFISKECYKKRKEKLKELKNTEIKLIENQENNSHLSIKEIVNIIKETSKNYKVLKKYDEEIKKFKNLYFTLEIVYKIKAEKLRKTYPNIKYFFSLGSPVVKLIAGQKEHFGIQHGTFSVKSLQNYPWFYNFNIDKGYVYGDIDFSWNFIYKETQLSALGNPYFDSIKKLERKKREKINIYFFSSLQGREFLEEQTFKILNDIKRELIDKVNLIIKLHPNEKKEIYLKYEKKYNDKLLIKTESIDKIIEDVDIGISIDSTSNYELLLYGKIVCQLFFEEWEEKIERQRFSLRIKNINQIKRLINTLSDEKYNRIIDIESKILKKYYLKNIGNSSKKIYEDILKNKREKLSN